MRSKSALLKLALVSFVVCIMTTANLFLGNTAQARDNHYKHNSKPCHKHWHKHSRNEAHKHRHCHHHRHEKNKKGRGHDGNRGRGHDDRDRHDDWDYDRGHDDRHGDRHDDRRGDDGRRGRDTTVIIPPPKPIKPPKPPTPWSIAKNTGKKVRFSGNDRKAIKKYYRSQSRRLQMLAPPSPPPGIDNLARRGAILPPGLKIPGLRSRLKKRLSQLPSGHKYGHLGRIVIIYDKRTRIIKDTKRAF